MVVVVVVYFLGTCLAFSCNPVWWYKVHVFQRTSVYKLVSFHYLFHNTKCTDAILLTSILNEMTVMLLLEILTFGDIHVTSHCKFINDKREI